MRVDPNELEAAFSAWDTAYAQDDSSLAIDGKGMCISIDESGRQTQIMSAVGHSTGIYYAQNR